MSDWREEAIERHGSEEARMAGPRPGGAGWHDEDAPRIDVSAFGQRPGSVTLPGPDPDRDARIDAYRGRERRRAARTLDRYLELIYDEDIASKRGVEIRVAGERFVEAVGDYVLSRMTGNPWGDAVQAHRDAVSDVQHNRHYDVTNATAVHVPHLHADRSGDDYKTWSCSRVECHNLGGPCAYCGGSMCRVRLVTGASEIPPCTCPRPYGRSEAPDPNCPQHMPTALQHKSDSGVGVPRCPVDGQWCSTCQIGGGNGTGGMCARQHKGDSGAPTPDDEPCRPMPDGGWRCVPWKPCAKPGGCLLPDDEDRAHDLCFAQGPCGDDCPVSGR